MNVFVTGASSGIGAATAEAFAAAGHRVAVCARREERLREVAAKAGDALVFPADLGELDALAALVAEVDDALGGIDVLVNNAGVPKRKRVRTMTPDDAESVMAINYFSPVRLTLAALPRMLERDRGEIVNISSMGVHSAAFGVGAYSATKAALELFTESLHLELQNTGVRARVVVPGTTRTEFSDDKEGNEPSLVRDAATYATPDQVARAILESVGTDAYLTYATAQDAATAAAKSNDPNAFLQMAGEALKPLL